LAIAGACVSINNAMLLEIPDEILRASGLTSKDCLIELALHFYAERKIHYAQALRLSGLQRPEFDAQLARYNITLYTLEDLRQDVAALQELGRL